MIWKELIFIFSTILIFKVFYIFTGIRSSEKFKNEFQTSRITCTVLVLFEKKTYGFYVTLKHRLSLL